ncbi:MAG: ABC transporter ATP-binding protein [Clostridia bacterium]|nr:ABC transporter ATP-binding protein [Clostridia bacterium]
MSKTIVQLDHVFVRYNLAMQKNLGLKDYLKAIAHKELLFQEFMALKDISVEIKQGESWGFVGKNGSGKSTLLKLITGILRPYKGNVIVNGSIAPLLELGAGFDLELTGRENIIMNGLILGMSEKDVRARFDEIVDFAEIEPFLDVPIKNYSSGMKSRLGFAVATSARADILIADEVLATGDKAFQAKCEKRMQSLLDGGTTLLFVSHSNAAVRRMCQKSLWLNAGTMQMAGETEEVLSAYDQFVTAQQNG